MNKRCKRSLRNQYWRFGHSAGVVGCENSRRNDSTVIQIKIKIPQHFPFLQKVVISTKITKCNVKKKNLKNYISILYN